jgi:hypothetical protein
MSLIGPRGFMETEGQFREHCWQVARSYLFAVFDDMAGGPDFPWRYTETELDRLQQEVAAAFSRVLWDGAVEPVTPEAQMARRDLQFQRFMETATRNPGE